MPSFDPSRIASNLQKGLPAITIASPSAGRAGSPGGSAASRPADRANEQRWHQALSAELYRRWAQPSRAEIGSAQPTVTVSLTINADGRVAVARVSGPSRVLAMDATVQSLLESLRTLPSFRDYGLDGSSRALTVTFRLTT